MKIKGLGLPFLTLLLYWGACLWFHKLRAHLGRRFFLDFLIWVVQSSLISHLGRWVFLLLLSEAACFLIWVLPIPVFLYLSSFRHWISGLFYSFDWIREVKLIDFLVKFCYQCLGSWILAFFFFQRFGFFFSSLWAGGCVVHFFHCLIEGRIKLEIWSGLVEIGAAVKGFSIPGGMLWFLCCNFSVSSIWGFVGKESEVFLLSVNC